ncbi:hypothetical protein SK128_006336 [Halocaridina rubra]|uniref:Uncharacterized protein n=1 Tax=Halocaridina rubra TaxID=373956 RepID=A0AAN8WJQ0_HALRR
MKIQVGSKGEVAWDVFLEALRKEELLEERLRHSRSSLACAKRWPRKCLDHRVILVLLLGICLLSYGLMYWINLKLSALKNQTGHIVYNNALGKVYHIHFSWKNCGQSDDPMQLTKLKVSPDPVHLDRNITLDLVSFINMDIDKDHQLSVRIGSKNPFLVFFQI